MLGVIKMEITSCCVCYCKMFQKVLANVGGNKDGNMLMQIFESDVQQSEYEMRRHRKQYVKNH
jgi:hypothetical protein